MIYEKKLFLLCYKTALYLAVEKDNYDIIRLLLSNDAIDPNITIILMNFFFCNNIPEQSIQFNLINTNHLMQFSNKFI